MYLFDTVAIIGPGLVGGSMGIAIRRRKLAQKVVGIGRRRVSLDRAMAAGACDETTLEPAEGVRGADLAVLATPIRAFGQLAPIIASSMKPGAILTDVASSKGSVIELLCSALSASEGISYVPTHPMAGSERRGPAAADEALFEGSICIFTPLPGTGREPIEHMRKLWEGLGARVELMSPSEHDRLVARISHMPHLAAASMVAALDEESLFFSGGGLIDTTRVASSDPDLWADICKSNAEHISSALRDLIEMLQDIQGLVSEGNVDGLRDILREAKRKRDDLLARRARPGNP